ncbi:hypothetical protein [Leuconostoc miyukkimchii]|nr:hypothetical protein [Leuconostoc miyukkimchii]
MAKIVKREDQLQNSLDSLISFPDEQKVDDSSLGRESKNNKENK